MLLFLLQRHILAPQFFSLLPQSQFCFFPDLLEVFVLLLKQFQDPVVFHILYRAKIQVGCACHIYGIFSEVLLLFHYHLLLFQDVKVLPYLHLH